MYLLPPLTSIVALVVLWLTGTLRRPRLVAVAVATGVALQMASETYSAVWLGGLLVNVAVSVCLLIRAKTAW